MYADEQRLSELGWNRLKRNEPAYFDGLMDCISYEICLICETSTVEITRPLNLLENKND
jgi:hypothetical protein